jgi:hypothetical protein
MWADGIHLQARFEDEAQCILLIIGATPERKKELVGFGDGMRESNPRLACTATISSGVGSRLRPSWLSPTSPPSTGSTYIRRTPLKARSPPSGIGRSARRDVSRTGLRSPWCSNWLRPLSDPGGADGHNQLPKLVQGVKFADGLEVIAKPISRRPRTAA